VELSGSGRVGSYLDEGEPVNPVRCSFYVRTPDGDGFRYDPVDAGGPNGDLPTTYPPAIGDLISLKGGMYDVLKGGMYEVVARQWMHASLGSFDWPYGPEPKVGPMLNLIVVPAVGVFRDEVPPTEEDDE
jgi:hypothetical protein